MARLFFLEGEKKEGKVRVRRSLGRAIWWKEEEDVGEGGGGWVGGAAKDVPAFCLQNREASSTWRLCLQQFGSAAPSSHPRYGSLSDCCGSSSVQNTGVGSDRSDKPMGPPGSLNAKLKGVS